MIRNKLALTILSMSAVLLLGGSARAQKANLLMVIWSAPTAATGYGSKMSVSFKVTNYGNGNAGAFGVRFYYGNSSSTSGLTTLGTHSFSGLAAATTAATRTITLTLPGTVLNGTRYLHYHIDHANQVSESNENDNRGYRNLSVTGLPDFKVTKVAVSPGTQSPGGGLNVTYRVYNAGHTMAPTHVYTRFYYSMTSAINTTDTYLNRQITVPSLAAGAYYPAASDGATTVTVPTGATAGTRYIGAIIDYNHRVTEYAVVNNTGAGPFSVKGGTTSKADLSMYSWSAPSSAKGYGTKVTIPFRVRNSGSGAAGAFQVRFYYGHSTSYGLTYLTSYSHPGLSAGAVGPTRTVSVLLPNTSLYGYRYLLYSVDSASQVAETNESNNIGNRKLLISGRPDLQVSTLTVSPTSQQPGGALTVTYRIRNAGLTQVPTYFYTRFYFSNDSAIKTSDTYLSQQITINTLVAGAYYPASSNGTLTLKLPAGAAAGTRYIGAIADYNNRVGDSNTGNNARAAAMVVKSTKLPKGGACTAASQCSTGHCVDGVCCNNSCGGGLSSDCKACSKASGSKYDGTCWYVNAGVLCRTASGPCDLAEKCNGSSEFCPTNLYKSAKTSCRAATGVCDQAETCTGKSAGCPANLYKSSNTTCRAAQDAECGLAEKCTGKSTSCPKDLHKPNNLPCTKGVCSQGLCKKQGPPADEGVDKPKADAAGPDTRPHDGVIADRPAAGEAGADLPAPGDAAPQGDAGEESSDRGCSCQGGTSGSGAGLMLTLLALLGLIRRGRIRS